VETFEVGQGNVSLLKQTISNDQIEGGHVAMERVSHGM